MSSQLPTSGHRKIMIVHTHAVGLWHTFALQRQQAVGSGASHQNVLHVSLHRSVRHRADWYRRFIRGTPSRRGRYLTALFLKRRLRHSCRLPHGGVAQTAMTCNRCNCRSTPTLFFIRTLARTHTRARAYAHTQARTCSNARKLTRRHAHANAHAHALAHGHAITHTEEKAGRSEMA